MADSEAPAPPSVLVLSGLNHIKLPCLSIQKTLDFYTKILSFQYIPQYDHFTPEHKVFAKMMHHKNVLVELRYHPEQAEAQRGWDPITWGVSKKADLEHWGKWLDENGVKRSKVFTAIKSWVMAAEDPDGRVVRLYVEDEEHEWTHHPDQDEYWLSTPKADPALS